MGSKLSKDSKDKYTGKVLLVNLPNNQRPRYRWIVRKRDDNRYIIRAPKKGVKIKNLDLKRNADYNKEHLMPKKATFYKGLK